MSVKGFETGCFYVMTPPGEEWHQYEGPFATQDEAVDYLRRFISEWSSPEMLRMIVVYFNGSQVDMVRVDGVPLNGEYLANASKG